MCYPKTMLVLAVCFSLSCHRLVAQSQQAPRNTPPPIEREFRAAWIATVANIDWPSKPGLSVEQQQAELASLMDTAVRLNLNAIILQVRPACDALYQSDLEPWSEYLTGEQGKPPEPFYDPLAWAVEQAHQRGLQLHAWLNPYRAMHPTAKSKPSENHVSNRQPEMVRKYGKQVWLDPGDEQAAEHSLAVLLDIVRRYDIDGIHFDDYFYPYPIEQPLAEGESEETKKAKQPFPDDPSWQRYCDATPEPDRLSRGDWRRDNIHRFIKRVHEGVRQEKPHVLFGVSPFGIWRPGHPTSIAGFDAYEAIYADSLVWLQNGWVDYFTPQLYWPVRSEGQSYPVLLNWWRQQNLLGRHLWPGNYTSRVGEGEGKGWKALEVIEQIELTRGIDGANGNVHFSIKALAGNWGGLADDLLAGPYAEPAVVPATPWLAKDLSPPAMPEAELKKTDNGWQLQISGDVKGRFLTVVQWRAGDRWQTKVMPLGTTTIALPGTDESTPLTVTAIDRLGQASLPLVLSAH